MLVANLLGLAGLLGISVAVGALTSDVWWGVLVASIAAVVVSVVSGLDARALDDEPDEEPATVPAPPPGGGGVT